MQQKIICSKCGAENPPDTQYCLYCGAILQDICPNCGSVVVPTSKFCSNCGAGLGWGMRLKDIQQQIFQTESKLTTSFTQYSQDVKDNVSNTVGDLKTTLSTYSGDLLAQQNVLANTTASIQKLMREEHRMSLSRSLTKIGLALTAAGLGVISLSYVLKDYSMLLALAGMGIILIGFILQFISAFYTA